MVTRTTQKPGISGGWTLLSWGQAAGGALSERELRQAGRGPSVKDANVTVLRTDEVAEERDLVGVYLHEISKTPLLDAAQEVDLSKAIEAGLYAEHLLEQRRAARAAWDRERAARPWSREGETAKDRFIRANLRLVVSIARRYVRSRHADARPDPGGQHRSGARGREVRLRARLQVLDVRDVVDPPGDQPGHRPAGAHRAAAGAPGRGRQPDAQRGPPADP